ncbi:integral membrane protein TerC family protein [Methylomusa anaerophila]|uniref:Integral membrane protein TerC family protein n=1 Tax=Methylomusa anaerophila TaxID=1930071 RepID=A0A348AFM7_9FIRM|nr:integral membrane protein TerC family protein [Methylomusa anaerophila]
MVGLGSITLIDLILSGDNAVIIALASRNLPREQRKKAIIWGSVGAVALRILLTTVAAILLTIPYLQLAGGLALLCIAIALLAEKKDVVSCEQASTLTEAIKTILLADVIMSMDNVLAIAGASGGNIILLAVGLVMSIPLVVFGSGFVMKLMDRYPAIIYLGAAILGWTAAKMVVKDGFVKDALAPYALAIELLLTVGVLIVGHILKKKTYFGSN